MRNRQSVSDLQFVHPFLRKITPYLPKSVFLRERRAPLTLYEVRCSSDVFVRAFRIYKSSRLSVISHSFFLAIDALLTPCLRYVCDKTLSLNLSYALSTREDQDRKVPDTQLLCFTLLPIMLSKKEQCKTAEGKTHTCSQKGVER